MDVVKARANVMTLQNAILSMPGAIMGDVRGNEEIPVYHHFANGVYCREMHLPKDSVSVGKIHRYETNNMLLQGHVAVVNPEEPSETPLEYIAPCIWRSPAKSKRAILCIEDAVWVTTHPVDPSYTEDDIEKIAQEVIVDNFEELE